METIAEFLRDPPTWFFVVEVVTGSLIGLYVAGRIRAWRTKRAASPYRMSPDEQGAYLKKPLMVDDRSLMPEYLSAGASVPIVPRYNPWGQWKPICGTGPSAQFIRIQRATKAIPLPAAAAVHAYCAYTGFLGIEFVVLAGWPDEAPFRSLPSDILLVPCRASLDDGTGALPTWWLYDGWMPIESSSLEAILAGLGRIDETVSLLAYEFGLSARWVVKYVETVRVPRTYRDLDSSHFAEAEGLSGQLDALPQPLRAATARAIHWFQQAQLANTLSQRFLLHYFALETLVLALWEDGREIGLPLPDTGSESKADQRARRNEAILSDMETRLGQDPIRTPGPRQHCWTRPNSTTCTSMALASRRPNWREPSSSGLTWMRPTSARLIWRVPTSAEPISLEFR